MHPDVFSKDWFKQNQSKLLRFANTFIGRKILGIKKKSINKIDPSSIHFKENGKQYAEFRTKNIYALRLYKKLKPLWHLLHAWDMAVANNLKPQLNAGFDTFSPDADPESTSVDGEAGRVVSSPGVTFSSLRSGNGNEHDDDDSGGQGMRAIIFPEATTNRYLRLLRAYTVFDTSSINGEAIIEAATLSVYISSKFNEVGTTNLHVAGTTSTATTSLANSDYQKVLRTSFGSVSYASVNTSNYNDIALNSFGLSNISKTSLSRFTLQTGFDINNTTPTWGGFPNFGSGFYMEQSESPGEEPTLTVELSYIISMAGTSNTSFTPTTTYFPDETLSGTSSISAYGRLLTDTSVVTKSYLYKIYDTSDNFLGVWNDVKNEFVYSQEINSVGSAIQVELARNSDSRFVDLEELQTHASEDLTTQGGDTLIVGAETTNNIGPGSDVDLNYRVEVWVFYGEIQSLETSSSELLLTNDGEELQANIGAVGGLRKFNGYITRYVSQYGSEESVLVSVSSFGVELDNYVLESGSDTTVAYSSQAPNAIVQDALDKFTTAGGLVDYSSSSIDATGTTVTYSFRLNTYREVLDICLKLAPYDWYWRVGLGDDTVYFQQKPTTPSHYFVLKKHIHELNLEYYIENITNVVYVTGGDTGGGSNLFKKYTDATSISNYRQGLKRITDHRVTVSATADLLSEGETDRNDAPQYRSSVTILDSDDIDIETIQLGQLIGFRNFGNYIDDVEMQIVAIDYEPDRVTLQLDTLLPRVNKRIEDLKRNLVELDNVDTPDAPS